MAIYVVLNDGDTFSTLQGCKLVIIDEDALDEESMEGLKDGVMKDVIGGSSPAVAAYDLYTIVSMTSLPNWTQVEKRNANTK